MSDTADYKPPAGQVALTGPVTRPATGTLPLRGDLAHLALAGRYFVPHYAVPCPRTVGEDGAPLQCHADRSSQAVTWLDAGSAFELLDIEGEWCWGCVGPEGPSGWVETSLLVPT